MDLGLKGKVAVVTGGGGAICGEIARALAAEGAAVAIWDLSAEAAERKAAEIATQAPTTGPAPPPGEPACGGPGSGPERAVSAHACDVLDRGSVREALHGTLERHGSVDILVNGAGGSRREATTSAELSFFDIPTGALEGVTRLNYLSAVIPSQEVGREFAEQGTGVILNVSSVAGTRPLTRAVAYSNGKAATDSFTLWLAVHMAREYSPRIRVNAIAPGFILTEQNRFLLLEEDGGLTERGRQVLGSVPMARLGRPEEIAGAALYLVSPQASFVTGAVIVVDGGLSAWAGV